jgi:membrane-associated protease RseP (regulator of RpoE activity)
VAIPAVVVGLHLSTVASVHPADPRFFQLGEPLLFVWIESLVIGPVPVGSDVVLHPLAFAGWVGFFITGLNLIPVGQLDGGHVAYALFGKAAHKLAILLVVAFAVFMVYSGYFGWILWLVLVLFIGPMHPPTANDNVPLGWVRRMVGIAALLFVIVGFTPTPFLFGD